MNPFEYLNTINTTKKDIMVDDAAEKSYNAYMVNRSLSYFNDSVLYANEMNKYHHLDNKLQYHFLINSIRPRKRFSKWMKKSDQDSVEVVKEYYGVSKNMDIAKGLYQLPYTWGELWRKLKRILKSK